MCNRLILVPSLAMLVVAAMLVGCATTRVDISPSPQAPVCDGAASALVFWAAQWRPNQKDVSKREAAAQTGLKEFLQTSGCFKNYELRRVAHMSSTMVIAEIASAHERFSKMVIITLKELGPVIKLLSSFALIDGGTEVVLQVAEYIPPNEVQLDRSPFTGKTVGLGSSKAYGHYLRTYRRHSQMVYNPASN